MKFKIRATRSIRLAVVAASVLAMTVGLAANAAAKKSSIVHISVVSLIPGSTHAAFSSSATRWRSSKRRTRASMSGQVQYQWLASTFAAKLAAGTLPTVFTVPFTDGRSLGDNGQLANLTKYAKACPTSRISTHR